LKLNSTETFVCARANALCVHAKTQIQTFESQGNFGGIVTLKSFEDKIFACQNPNLLGFGLQFGFMVWVNRVSRKILQKLFCKKQERRGQAIEREKPHGYASGAFSIIQYQ
jgi:hypothetical protein